MESDSTDDSVSLPRGRYACLDRHHVGLFALDWQLYVYIDHKVVRATQADVGAMHRKIGVQSELTLDVGAATYTMKYYPVLPEATYLDLEEDMDFGLWIANTLGSEERRRLLIESWTNYT